MPIINHLRSAVTWFGKCGVVCEIIHWRRVRGVQPSRSPAPSVCRRQAGLGYVDTPVSDVPTARATLQSCITDVGDWWSSRRLQLNETKTELIWHGSQKILGKVPESELNLTVGSNIIQPVKSVRDLGVQLDIELSIKAHVSKVASSCFYQLRRLWQIRRFVGQKVAAQLVSTFVLSRLDYCNSVIAGFPRCATEPLQCVMNAAARLVLNLLYACMTTYSVTPALQQLHWLPIEYRSTYKLCLIMHLVHSNRAPQYLSDSVQTVSRSSSRPGLRSSDTAVHTLSRGAEPSSESAASFMLDLLHGTVFHTISIKLVTLIFSSAVSKLNYFVEHWGLCR